MESKVRLRAASLKLGEVLSSFYLCWDVLQTSWEGFFSFYLSTAAQTCDFMTSFMFYVTPAPVKAESKASSQRTSKLQFTVYCELNKYNSADTKCWSQLSVQAYIFKRQLTMWITCLVLLPLFARGGSSPFKLLKGSSFHRWTGTKIHTFSIFLTVWLPARLAFHGPEMPAVRSHNPLWYNASHNIVWALSWSFWSACGPLLHAIPPLSVPTSCHIFSCPFN